MASQYHRHYHPLAGYHQCLYQFSTSCNWNNMRRHYHYKQPTWHAQLDVDRCWRVKISLAGVRLQARMTTTRKQWQTPIKCCFADSARLGIHAVMAETVLCKQTSWRYFEYWIRHQESIQKEDYLINVSSTELVRTQACLKYYPALEQHN